MAITGKIRHQYNSGPSKGEVNLFPTKTIPDQVFSLKELLDRNARGLAITGEKFPIYHEDENGNPEEMPDLRKMDLSEIHDLKTWHAEYLKEQREQYEEKRKQSLEEKRKQAAEQQQQQFEAFEQYLNSKRSAAKGTAAE